MTEHFFGYDDRLPDDVRDEFMWLCQETASLFIKWDFYKELFGKDDDLAFLSDLAPASFRMIEESLRIDMTMSICRLSDPAESGRRREQANLSFPGFKERHALMRDVSELLDGFTTACKPVRRFRDKLVAHSDLTTKLQTEDNPMFQIGRSQIDTIVDLAARTLNEYYSQYVDGGLGFEHAILIGGAGDLLYWLRLGKQHSDEEPKRYLGASGVAPAV